MKGVFASYSSIVGGAIKCLEEGVLVLRILGSGGQSGSGRARGRTSIATIVRYPSPRKEGPAGEGCRERYGKRGIEKRSALE